MADQDDARAIRVRLTARGCSYARAVRAFTRGVEDEWGEHVGRERITELCATLDLLRTKVFLDSK